MRYYYRYDRSVYYVNRIKGIGKGEAISITTIRNPRRNYITSKIINRYPFRAFIIMIVGIN